ncbi:hypothetical protein ACTABX_00250 [Pseudomonas syringae]
MEEGLRFSATQMKKHMDAKRKTESMVIMPRPTVVTLERFRDKLWTQTSFYAMNAENLGSYVYANRMGNDSEESKDE